MRAGKWAIAATSTVLVAAVIPTVARLTSASAAGPSGTATIPREGTTVSVTETATAVLDCHGSAFTMYLSGHAKLTVGRNIRAINGDNIQPIATEDEHLEGEGPHFGDVTMTDASVVVGELVDHSPHKVFPAKASLPIDPIFTMDFDPCAPALRLHGFADDGPPILRSSNVTHFPPQNDRYQLEAPMLLQGIEHPGPIVATIISFAVEVNATPSK